MQKHIYGVNVVASESVVSINGVDFKGKEDVPMDLYLNDEWDTVEDGMADAITDGWINEDEVAKWLPIFMKVHGLLPGLSSEDNGWIINRRKELGLM